MRIDFLRFSNNAISPTKGSADAAGNDLYLTEEALVPPSSASFMPGLASPCSLQTSVME